MKVLDVAMIHKGPWVIQIRVSEIMYCRDISALAYTNAFTCRKLFRNVVLGFEIVISGINDSFLNSCWVWIPDSRFWSSVLPPEGGFGTPLVLVKF